MSWLWKVCRVMSILYVNHRNVTVMGLQEKVPGGDIYVIEQKHKGERIPKCVCLACSRKSVSRVMSCHVQTCEAHKTTFPWMM